MMARKSSIEQLPPELLTALQDFIRDPKLSRSEVTERINALAKELGQDGLKLSRSAVGRYAKRMEQVGSRLKESHEVADMWITQFGQAPDGQLGQLIIQMVRTMAFDLQLQLAENGEIETEDMPAAVKMLKDMSIMLEKTERAATINSDRVAEIAKAARLEAADDVADEIKANGGISEELEASIRRVLLGTS